MPQRDLRSRIDDRLKALKNTARNTSGSANSPLSCSAALESCRKHPAVVEACKLADVDPNDPAVLSAMLIALASARFSKGKGGSPELWDSFMLSSLLRHYLLRVNRRPELSDEKILGQMVREMKQFQGMKASTLRRRLSDALKPQRNLLLRHLLANMEETSRTSLKRRGYSLPDWRTLPDHWDAVIKGR